MVSGRDQTFLRSTFRCDALRVCEVLRYIHFVERVYESRRYYRDKYGRACVIVLILCVFCDFLQNGGICQNKVYVIINLHNTTFNKKNKIF